MISTVDSEIQVYDGVANLVAKVYPDWYGIPDVGFIWYGNYSDPYIEYNGKQIDAYIVEDTMWERFREEFPHGSDGDFDQYMLDHREEVYELIELAMSA